MPGWTGHSGQRPAASLSCRGSSSPKFPGLPPLASPPLSRIWAGSMLGSEPPPRPDLPRLPLQGTWETHWGAKTHRCRQALQAPNSQFGLDAVTGRKGWAPLGSSIPSPSPPNTLLL